MLVGATELIAAIGQIGDLPTCTIVHQHLGLDSGILLFLGRADDANDLPATPSLIVRFAVLVWGSVFLGLDN